MDETVAIIKALMGRRVISYYPHLARQLKSISAALFLQQIMFHAEDLEEADDQGWVEVGQQTLEWELAMSGKVQRTARTVLAEAEVMEERRAKKSGGWEYRVRWGNLKAVLKTGPNGTLKSRSRGAQQDSPDGHPPILEEVETGNSGTNVPSSAEAESGEAVPLNQFHMKRIYDHLKANKHRLDGREFSTNLGFFNTMMEHDEPTEAELEDLPKAALEYFEWHGKLDVGKALRRWRQQAARRRREAGEAQGPKTEGITITGRTQEEIDLARARRTEGYEDLFDAPSGAERRRRRREREARGEQGVG